MLVGALLERYVLKVALLERTEVDGALRVWAWLGEALLEKTLLKEALLERTEVGRALLCRVPMLGYAEAALRSVGFRGGRPSRTTRTSSRKPARRMYGA
jgi:hypothetical protein